MYTDASESVTHSHPENHLTNLNFYWQNYTAGCEWDSVQQTESRGWSSWKSPIAVQLCCGSGGICSPSSSSAADAHTDGHEGAKRPPALHHGLPYSSHQLPAPHADPEAGERAKHGASSHSYCKPHHEAHLDPVKTAGLGLSVRTYSHRHLQLCVQKYVWLSGSWKGRVSVLLLERRSCV